MLGLHLLVGLIHYRLCIALIRDGGRFPFRTCLAGGGGVLCLDDGLRASQVFFDNGHIDISSQEDCLFRQHELELPVADGGSGADDEWAHKALVFPGCLDAIDHDVADVSEHFSRLVRQDAQEDQVGAGGNLLVVEENIDAEFLLEATQQVRLPR